MKHTIKIIQAACLWGGLFLVCSNFAHSTDQKRTPAAGHWRMVETLENDSGTQTFTWAFELVEESAPTSIAVGSRSPVNGAASKDRTAAIIFFDFHEDGSLSGSLIVARGDGSQIELSLDIDLEADRKQIVMAAFDREGSITAKFKGEWLGKGISTPFQPGKWEVREIVAPDKGNWDIQWNYQFTESGGKIAGKGNKALINNRKAYSGETKTRCDISLERPISAGPGNLQNTIIGKGVETSPKGRKSRANYEGWLAPSGKTFFLMSYESDGLAALMIGRHAE
jgi:hypothetical protein